MQSMSQLLNVLLPILYIVTVFYFGHIFFGRNKKLETKTTLLLISLLVIHAVQIILRAIAIGTIPLVTKFDALSFLAFAIVFVYLIIELSVLTKATGFFVLILAFFIQSTSSILYTWDLTQNPLLNNPIYAMHVVLTILGYTAICISALYALFYIMLNHNIKYHRLGLIYEKLPPLNLLEKMSIRSVQIGILFLAVGILLGHLQARDMKIIFSDFIWFCYFLGYITAQLKKWRGKWMAYLSMTGFGMLVLTNITLLFIENSYIQF
jgi:HemX protein